MKISIALLIIIFGCAGKSTERVRYIRDTEIDTFLIKSYLDNPVDFERTGELKVDCVILDTFGIGFPRIRHKCLYISETDTLARIKFSTFKTDSTWIFGTSGFKIEAFECEDGRMPLQHRLEIGTSLAEFQMKFGQFNLIHQDEYSKLFNIQGEEIKVILKTKDEKVIGIVITAANDELLM